MAVREIRPSVHGRYNITAPHSDLPGIFWISHLNFHKKNNILISRENQKQKLKQNKNHRKVKLKEKCLANIIF